MEHYKNLSLENIIYTNDNGEVCEEIWKDVVGYEGYYKASDLGRIKSLDRLVPHSKTGFQIVKERILKQNINKRYCTVVICKDKVEKKYLVHQLIFLAFHGFYPKRDGLKRIDHIDNVSLNNKITNLNLVSVRVNSTKDLVLNKKFLGVKINGNKFYATIYYKNKYRNLGTYETEEEAALAYKTAFNLIEEDKDVMHLFRTL